MSSKFVLIFVCTLTVEIGTVVLNSSGMPVEAGEQNLTESRNPENILCRGCGSDSSSANFITSKLSPSSHYAFNDTLFDREMVMVQVLSQDLIFQFPVITTTQSTCEGFGEWQVDNSWFPGYRWRVCGCPDCGAFLGWVFESSNPSSLKSPQKVFCLVLTSVVGEYCNYTLHHKGFFGSWYCCQNG